MVGASLESRSRDDKCKVSIADEKVPRKDPPPQGGKEENEEKRWLVGSKGIS
jgi:hypothetical protein